MKSPAENLERMLRAAGVKANAIDLVRMLGRGAITPSYILDITGNEVAQQLAQRIRDDNWDSYRHETFSSIRKARRLAYDHEADNGKQFALWAKRNGFAFPQTTNHKPQATSRRRRTA